MPPFSINTVSSFSVLGSETSIISRREIEPLLVKARQVLVHYKYALGCSVSIQDRKGHIITVSEYGDQIQLCELCEKYRRPLYKVQKENERHCKKFQSSILTEAQNTGGVYIYTCELGFVYWTSPLYRNGRYAGALTAGQVLSCNRKTVMKKIRSFCTDNIAEKNFSGILDKAPEKNHNEIRAMAKMLRVCAEEISEKAEESQGTIYRTVWIEKEKKEQKTMTKNQRTKNFTAALSSGSPLEKERTLLAAFRRGDKETGNMILKELMDCVITAIPGNLEIIRFRAIELIVLLSRAAANSKISTDDSPPEVNSRHIRRIQESKTPEEIIDNLRLIAERMAGRIFSFQGIRHSSALRRAERFIWENYTRKISLEEIAKVSGLSAPYFSSIFKAEMGENLSCYLNRLRVERATVLLTETGKPLNEIARLCGFVDQSWFSKIFKNYTGISPGKHRKHGGRLPVHVERKYSQKEIIFPCAPMPCDQKQHRIQ